MAKFVHLYGSAWFIKNAIMRLRVKRFWSVENGNVDLNAFLSCIWPMSCSIQKISLTWSHVELWSSMWKYTFFRFYYSHDRNKRHKMHTSREREWDGSHFTSLNVLILNWNKWFNLCTIFIYLHMQRVL